MLCLVCLEEPLIRVSKPACFVGVADVKQWKIRIPKHPPMRNLPRRTTPILSISMTKVIRTNLRPPPRYALLHPQKVTGHSHPQQQYERPKQR